MRGIHVSMQNGGRGNVAVRCSVLVDVDLHLANCTQQEVAEVKNNRLKKNLQCSKYMQNCFVNAEGVE